MSASISPSPGEKPGTPPPTRRSPDVTAKKLYALANSHCVVQSSAFFITPTSSTPRVQTLVIWPSSQLVLENVAVPQPQIRNSNGSAGSVPPPVLPGVQPWSIAGTAITPARATTLFIMMTGSNCAHWWSAVAIAAAGVRPGERMVNDPPLALPVSPLPPLT